MEILPFPLRGCLPTLAKDAHSLSHDAVRQVSQVCEHASFYTHVCACVCECVLCVGKQTLSLNNLSHYNTQRGEGEGEGGAAHPATCKGLTRS